MADQPDDYVWRFDVLNPSAYANEARLHLTYARLRRDEPLAWLEPPDFRPFWAVTKHADILEISRQNRQFINEPRAVLSRLQDEEFAKSLTGGSVNLVRSLVQMDDPDHARYRLLTQAWFMPKNLAKREARVRQIAKATVDRMAEQGETCDFVSEVAVWYPLHVVMDILGVDPKDEPLMLKLTQELFGASDPDMARGTQEEVVANIVETLQDFYTFFTDLTNDRRKNPKDDVATIIANGTIDGKPLPDFETMSYYVIIATAGHDTTSSSTAGGLHALMEHPHEFAKLRHNPALIDSAIDEMIRWVTPVKHFMRTAVEDYEIRDKTIKSGESVMLLYWSGNRDEEAFEDPFEFRIDRSPNKHLAFGFGAHLCLGQHLAKMEMRALFEELLARVEWIELDGRPELVQSSFVSGLKKLPVRFKMK